ncbi:MAG: ABC transporter ATP-binding protein [Pseudomonadota bacterium]
MLLVDDLTVYRGPIEAVHGISFEVAPGSCTALLGPNGAGKTSTILALTGATRSTGRITFDGQDISRLPVESRIRAGMSVSPEGRRVFANLTVAENLRLGGSVRPEQVARGMQEWFDTFPILGQRRDQAAGTLSGGEQQMLAIARALMAQPRILLLDEPSLGLAPKIVAQIFSMIRTLKDRGMTILLVEQNATQALRLSDYAYLLINGRVAAHGTAETLAENASMSELTGIA